MKKLPITKEAYENSRYFSKKYGKLEYVSESGKLFKTSKDKILKFKESFNMDDYNDRPENSRPKYDIGEDVKVTWDFLYNSNFDDDEAAELENAIWTVEDVKEVDDGEFIYTISCDNPFDDEAAPYTFDDVEDYEIEPIKPKKPMRNRARRGRMPR